jgi:hypothetical protein
MEVRAAVAEARVAQLEAELARAAEWRRVALGAVVLVAVVAVVVLGIVAFNAVDDADPARPGLEFER